MLIPHDNNAHFISNYFSKCLYKAINLKAKLPLTSVSICAGAVPVPLWSRTSKSIKTEKVNQQNPDYIAAENCTQSISLHLTSTIVFSIEVHGR